MGIVVASISATAPGFARSLGASWDGSIVLDPIQDSRVSFLAFGPHEAQIELVEPAGDESPVARIASSGGGLHHLCYEVDSLESAIDAGRGEGAVLVRSPQPAAAFDGRRICWMFTRERLLVEYLESPMRGPM